MRLPTIFALSLALGAAGAYVALRPQADAPNTAAPAAATPAPAIEERRAAAPPTTLRPAAERPPLQPKPPAAPPRAPSALREPTAAELAAAQAARLVARERMSKEKIRGLLHDALDGKLADRELAPHDYDRLADAVLELRAAQRVLRNVDENEASAAVRDEHRQALLGALAEMEAITGVPPTQLGDILSADEADDPDAGLTDEANEDPASIVHETLPDDSKDAPD